MGCSLFLECLLPLLEHPFFKKKKWPLPRAGTQILVCAHFGYVTRSKWACRRVRLWKNNSCDRIFGVFFLRVSFLIWSPHPPPRLKEKENFLFGWWLDRSTHKKRTVQLWQMTFFHWVTAFTSSGSILVPDAFLVPCGLKNCRFILWIFPAALGPVFGWDFSSVCPL